MSITKPAPSARHAGVSILLSLALFAACGGGDVDASADAGESGVLRLAWDANTEADLVGYRIFVADSPDATEGQQIKEIKFSEESGFDRASPVHSFVIAQEPLLVAYVGKPVCFFLTAISANAESEKSTSICTNL